MERSPDKLKGIFFPLFVSLILCLIRPAGPVFARQTDPVQRVTPGPKAVHVLCYHAFLDNNLKMYTFTPSETEEHIQFFLGKGFRFLTLKDVLTGNYSGTRNIFVTIDDGNRSVYQAYYAVFRKYGITPLLAIYPSIIGKKDYALTWDQLKKLSRDGCPIASHGYTHQYVNKKLHDSNRALFDKEIVHSKNVLEKELGRTVDIFVYPFGVHSPVTMEKVKEAGYRYAFSIQGKHLGPEDFARGGLELPRYLLTRPNAAGLLAYISRDAEKLLKKKNAVADADTAGADVQPLAAADKSAMRQPEKRNVPADNPSPQPDRQKNTAADRSAKSRDEKKIATAEAPAGSHMEQKNPASDKLTKKREGNREIIADKHAKARVEKKSEHSSDRALAPVLYPVIRADEGSAIKHTPVQIKNSDPVISSQENLCEARPSLPEGFSPAEAEKKLAAAGISRESILGLKQRIQDRFQGFMDSTTSVYLGMVDLIRARVFALKKSLAGRIEDLSKGK